jgi:hypothetical protein
MEKARAAGKQITINELSDSERERWLEVGGKPIWDQWVKKMKSKGFGNAQEILDAAVALSK